MKPDSQFQSQPKTFWANVRTISENVGYTVRGQNRIKVPTLDEIVVALHKVGLGSKHVVGANGRATKLGDLLTKYYAYRAKMLDRFVAPRLMDASRAKALFDEQFKTRRNCPLPQNKQKDAKRAPAYLTGIVNMVIESNAAGYDCEYSPRSLTTVTKDGAPLRTLARWVDGAFPQAVNPIAVWEIKEYYYTTTFGSRVADGVYESLLDGMELEELREHEGVDVKHYLIVDAYDTWWNDGKSYLCRLIDMLHMGYVDEVLFGCEVVERLPALVKQWVREAKRRGLQPSTSPSGPDAARGTKRRPTGS